MRRNPVIEHYRTPAGSSRFDRLQGCNHSAGFFRIGEDTIAYGRTCEAHPKLKAEAALQDLSSRVEVHDSTCRLPFDPNEIVDNLRWERYRHFSQQGGKRSIKSKAYYALRPLLPFSLRARIKRLVHRGWESKVFPAWPVDCSVERILERLLIMGMKTRGLNRIPFIWFWPENYSSGVLMTHDVEEQAGLDGCAALMDLNEKFGVRASFQLIPEGRYAVTAELRDEIRRRGHEVTVHDWNHDGQLYSDRRLFLERAEKINGAAASFGADGFRSGALYRNLDWYDAFKFDYDMSVPNVGHLDAQPGGCCTVMPYFVNGILEIPVTMIQDYQLFHVLGQYSVDLWQQQLQIVAKHHGIASFIIHPDYILDAPALSTYRKLLAHLAELRSNENVWIALPGQINRWWRDRSEMTLVESDHQWKIEGRGSERATIAWAVLEKGELRYDRDPIRNKRERSVERAVPSRSASALA